MNRLGFYNAADPADARGFRDIIVTEAESPVRRVRGGRRDTSSATSTRSCTRLPTS